jgi:hypothetical protein
MKHLHFPLLAACLMLTGLLVVPAAAYDQPSVNLGFTSFLDGAPPAGPGWYFAQYVEFYSADKLANMGIDDPQVDVWASLTQLIYQSNQNVLLGGKWGIDLIVPFASLDSTPVPDNGAGIGDILVGPYLQWDPIMGKNGPAFVHRIELQTIFPTGKYANDKPLNPGSNFYSFDPYWAGTFFLYPKLEASWRVHYLWNGKNNDPFIGYSANDSQAGQAFHANFAASYEFVPKQFRLGVNGYYFKQLEDSEVNGQPVLGREQVLGIGPGALVSFSQNTHLFLNAYWETSAKYRPEGERFIARVVHHF